MSEVVTVAIPVRDGRPLLEQTLRMVRAQRLAASRSLELVVCDSGSRDGSPQLARRFGARVIAISPERFSHGATRNLLMERSSGVHVAFLTQDSLPADEHWLSRLLDAFSLSDDVGLTFGPYRPRADASPMVARELTQWFDSFSTAGRPRVDRLGADERCLDSRALMGPRAFFTDANGCVARAAWERFRFPDVPYAEDHALALRMLRGGYAKVFEPAAAVIHSHDYSAWGWLRRSFDESRALHDIYGWVAPLDPRSTGLSLWGLVGADWRWINAQGAADLSPAEAASALARSAVHHLARLSGAALGSRSDRIKPALARRLSLVPGSR